MGEEFEDLTARAGNVVGEHEVALRKHLGDKRYDEEIAMQDDRTRAGTRLTTARAKEYEALAAVLNVLATILFSFLVAR